MEPLPSYWTYDRFLRQLNNGALKSIMADLVRKLHELGVVDASLSGLDSTPVMANTKQNNPNSFAKSKFSKENRPKSDPDCAVGVHSASNQHNERRYEFYWEYKSHVLVDCISSGHTPCGRSVSVTIPASNPQVRNGCGCAAAPAWRTSTHWLISLLWLLLWPPFCPILTPAVHPDHSGEELKASSHMTIFARFSSGLAFYALFRSLSPFVLGLVLRNPTSYKTIYYGHMQHHLRENTREQDDISILGGYFL